MNDKPKQVNFNSVLTIVFGIGIAVISFFSRATLSDIKENQVSTKTEMKEIRNEIVPRPEITLMIDGIKQEYLRQETETLALRARVTLVELELAKHFSGK